MSDKKDGAVLFIHGFLGSPDFFNQFIPQIPENYAIHNMLLHGHGGSVRDFANASMKMWKSQVFATVRALAKQYKKIIIVAHSMGTFFAMEAAAAFPERIKGVFLLGVPLKIFVRPIYFTNGLRLLFNLFPKGNETRILLKNALGVDLNKRVWEYIGWLPRCMEVIRESKRVRSTIRKVNIPCFIFQSGHDEVVSDKSLKYIPETENITVKVLQDSAHFIYSDGDFLKISKLLTDFLS